MVRIPRTEPTVRLAMANQPTMNPDALTGPGRALQGLGRAIAGLSGAVEGLNQEQIAEQDFADKMLMLQTDNELGLNQVETQANYQGTGDDYLPQRTEYYATTTNDAVSRMQPRNQRKAALFFEQRRGPYLERDAKFGGQRRQDTLIRGINDTVSTEYGKLANVPPEEFEQRFNETVQGVDFIIQAAPLPDKLKEQVAKGAAEQAYGILKGLSEDPETAPEIVPKILKMIEERPEEIDGGVLEEAPPEPETGAEGVQGLPGSPSGPALPKPAKLGAADVAPPQGPQTASYRILDAEAPTHAERNRIFKKGGVVVNLDTNWAKGDKPTTPMVVIPDNATKAQRQAAEAYASAMAGLYREKFGVHLKPKVVTRSVNGRGRPATIHTEPYAVTDSKAVAFFQTPEGAATHAQILRDTLGRIPGVVFSIPHDPTRKGDHGAEANGVNEVALARLVLAELKGGEGAPAPVRFAGLSKLGAGDVVPTGEARAPNTIPGEPQLVSGPEQAVRVADASGRFVPAPKPQTWRSVDSQLRDLLIKNMGTLKRLELEAERRAEAKEKEAFKQLQEQTFDQGFDLWRKGELSEAWIDENRPLLKSRDDQKLYQLIRSSARHIDPQAYHELLTRIDEDPQGAVAQARDDLANGRITPSFYDRIESRARREMQPETKTPAWAKRWEGEVREQVGTHQGDSWDRIERSQAAMREFEDYIASEIDKGTLDYDKVSKRAKQTIDDYKKRRVQQKQSALTIPERWSSATPETITLEEVADAKARILAAANEENQAANSDPEARKRVLAKYRSDYGQLDQWEKLLKERAEANGEKVPPMKPSMKLGGPKQEQGTVNEGTQQTQGVQGRQGSQSGAAPARQAQAQQGESRPVGGALGVVPLAENPDGSVSLSVPGMILEPWRAFQRGWARMGQVGNVDESGRMYTASDAARDSTGDAMTAAGVPLAATSFGSAVGAVPKGALGSGMVRAGEQAAGKEISPQGFYSGLDEALKGFNGTDVVTADTLAKRGVKKAEIEARGLSDLLSEGKSAKVSDLQRVAGENRVEVREKNYGANNPEFDALQMKGAELRERIDALRASGRDRERSLLGNGKTVDELEAEWSAMNARWREMDASSPKTKWSTYSLDPDNPTYRETVLHLPQTHGEITEWKVVRPDGQTRATYANEASARRAMQDGDTLRQAAPTQLETGFRSGHWSEPNVIAHLRTSIQKDAQGKDVFVVNELQSDWGQKLRDHGGPIDQGKIDDLKRQLADTIAKADAMGDARLAENNALFAPKTMREKVFGVSDQGGRIADREEAKRVMEANPDKYKDYADLMAARRRLEAEIRTVEASVTGHPLVNTTDQWVNTALRRLIVQAAESGADQIAIPSGDTVIAFGMGGKSDGIKYAYDQMYPKNLRNILKKIDPSIEPQKVGHLFGQKGQKLERSKGFITFKITPKLREAVKKEGMPLFTGGVPVDGSDRGEAE